MDVAEGLGLSYSAFSNVVTNGYLYFTVWPCGSKDGWSEEETHTAKLKTFAESLKNAGVEFGFCKFGSDWEAMQHRKRPLSVEAWHIDSCDAVAIRYALKTVMEGAHPQQMKMECTSLLAQLNDCFRKK